LILEVAVLDVRPGQERDFEVAFAEANAIISSVDGFQRLELLRGVENTSRYVMLVRWRSLTDHTEGFRQSDGYQRWKALLHHFYDPFPTVEHYCQVLTA
jgi:heme-degrading monooxygenase HmoA